MTLVYSRGPSAAYILLGVVIRRIVDAEWLGRRSGGAI
jgi:hypothetical protein